MAIRHMTALRDECPAGYARAAFLFMGSWTVGFGDEFSDVDVMALVTAEDCDVIRRHGRADRGPATRDLVDVRFYQLKSVCKTKTFASLADELASDPIVALWIYRHGEIIGGDPARFREIIDGAEAHFAASRESWLREHLVRARRATDWLVNFPNRGDPLTGVLLTGTLSRLVLRTSSLAAGMPYPYDKWLSPWIGTRVPGGSALIAAAHALAETRDPADVARAAEATYDELTQLVRRTYGDADWLRSPGDYIVSS
jgi:hypothetical protein